MEMGSVTTEEGTEKIKLSSRQSEERDVWAMQYYPFPAGGKEYKLSELATVEKGQMPQEVAKENQQYRLCLQYEYIGSSEQGHKLLKKDLEEFNEILPMGYTAKSEDNNWREDNFIFSVPSSVVTEPISIFRPYIGRIAENNLPAPIFSSAIRSLSRLK